MSIFRHIEMMTKGTERIKFNFSFLVRLVILIMVLSFSGSGVSQTTLAEFNFDDDNNDGWTLGAWGLNWDNDNQCSWKIGEPNGGRGYNNLRGQRGFIGNPDPTVDNTSDNSVNYVAGQGLSSDNKKEGKSGHYNNSSEWIQSPVVNCENHYDVTLEYYRWANFEPGYDFAFIEVSNDGSNWNTVYSPATLSDNGWVKHTLDISKYADRKSNVYIRWRSESDASIFYAGWNIDDVKITGKYNTNDNTSSISAGNITPPTSISSLVDTYSEKVTFGEFAISDAGSGDNLPTIIDTLVITPGDNNTIENWKKAITNIYLYNPNTEVEIRGEVYENRILFTNPAFLTISDGESTAFEISFYVEVILCEAEDNEFFEFKLDHGDVIVNPVGSFIGSGEIATGADKLRLDIQATKLSFISDPQQLVAPDRNLLPTVKVAATDINGNIDKDYFGRITLNNSGSLPVTGNTENAVDGIASFNSFQFTQAGGPVTLSTAHDGSSSISNATSGVSVTIELSLADYVFVEDFDKINLTGWTSSSNTGSNSWSHGEPNGGRGYDDLSRRYIGNYDPTVDNTASNSLNYVYGQGLGSSSRREGVSGHYNNSDEWLMSPAIDLSNYYNAELSFYRWANFEPYYDSAFVEISLDGENWIDLEQTVYPTDNNWTKIYIDISEIADRQSTVYIRWRSISDVSVFYSGWNIDDVVVTGIFSPLTNWLGTASTDWNNPSNWSSSSIPTRYSNVYIEANTPYRPIITSTAESNEIIIKKDAILVVDYSGSLTVFGDVQIETDNKNYGALIDRGSMTIHGKGKVSRYLSGKQWHYISSPVDYTTTTQFGEEIYYYDEPTASEDWNNGWLLAENIRMEKAKGYDIYKHKDDIVTLEGEFNSGSYGISVSNTDGSEIAEHEGWNLIGNPYPSAIDWDASGWTKTNINNAIYIWDQTQQNYVTYISGVGINGGSRYVPPMQGFFVKVTNPGSGYVGMTNDVRIANTQSKFKSAGSDKEGLVIRISGYSYSDETLVRIVENAEINFDNTYDAYKKFSDNSSVPQIFTETGKGDQLSINSIPQNAEYSIIPVNITVAGEGDYSLSFVGAWNLDLSKAVYLEDAEKDTLIDLRQINSYQFRAGSYEINDRFLLHVGMPLRLKSNVINASESSANGSIDLTIVGGSQPITNVKWSNGKTTEDISSLAAGNYVVTVTDNLNNTITDTITVGVSSANNSTSISGIDEIEENNVVIYTQGQQLHLAPSSIDIPLSNLRILDLNGRTVYSSEQEFYGETDLHLANLKGIYFVQVTQGDIKVVEKVIIK